MRKMTTTRRQMKKRRTMNSRGEADLGAAVALMGRKPAKTIIHSHH
jgi:hypothetical protein